MKKALIFFGIVIVVLLVVIATLPLLFKGQIKQMADKAISESVNAEVVWDVDDLSLTFFSNFPNLSAGISNIGVVNRSPFDGEILFMAGEVEIEIDVFSLFREQVRVVGLSIDEPVINILIDEEGRANYDIAVDSGSSSETEES